MRFLTILTLILTCTLSVTLSGQETFIAQDFEEAVSDEWAYTAQPQELQRIILWGRMNQPVGNTIAQSGDWYWATWDLDNMEHSLEFASVDLPFGDIYSLHFWYYSANLDNQTDYVKYCLEYDDGTDWNNWMDLDVNLTGWNQFSLDIPANESQVRLKVSAKYDGFAKYVHFDNFVINNEPAPLTAPLVSNITAEQITDGSKLVNIYYDLFDANNDLCDISLLISQNEGLTYTYIPDSANLSGHIGSDITPGNNKHIIWDAGNENQTFSAENYYFQIIAEDNTYLQIATPVISPESETYDLPQTITITCETEDVDIYYTLDGTDPDQTSTLYLSPFNLGSSATVKARAYKEDWQESQIASADYVINSDFVLVEGGTFTMGDTRGEGQSDEVPTHQVTLSSFYIGKYEVTQTEYQAVMGSNPSYFSGSDKPVEQVTWYNAVEYCNARSIQEGLTPCYNTTTWACDFSANGYRLPTEAEWEYAARGRTNDPDYLYAGSDDINSVAWYTSNSGSTTHNVGTKTPNSLGLYDMSGNVWEWCNDWYGSYSSSAQTDPVGSNSGSYRVLRGGGWLYDADYCRVALRYINIPFGSSNVVGFRVTRAAE